MSAFLSVDRAACRRCGACVRDCSFKALRLDDAGYPFVKKAERCMHCQHCFAICPTGAIAFDGKVASGSQATDALELPSATAAENWMRARRSMRHFAQEDVDRATLDRILHVLGNTPTGCNARGLTFHCFPTRAALDAFRQTFVTTLARHRDGTKLLPRWLAVPAINLRRGREDIFFRGASGLLIVTSDENNPAAATPAEDTVIACTNFEWLANANGIGTCWFGFLRHAHVLVPELLGDTLGIGPKTAFYAMLFGKPSIRHSRTVQRDDSARIAYHDEKILRG